MSRLGVRIVLWGVLCTATLGGVFAGVAGASSVQSLVEDALRASSVPDLLGPITESGRTGWACKPERAAAARHWQDAQLPQPSGQ